MAITKRKKKKSKSIGKLTDEAAKLLQLLVRLKASDDNGYCECITCGKVDHYKCMQGGHFMSRGKAATKLLEENIHPQCPYCNQHGMKLNAEKVYTLYMIDMYGRVFVDEMIALSKTVHKWVRCDIEDLIKEFKERIKEQEARIL